MKKRFFLLALLPFAAACTLQEVGALNPQFLDPIHGMLFKNEFQVNDFQYLFDASNKTVAIKSRRSSETVDGIYSLELLSNPSLFQGVYRMKGSKSYNNFFMGLEYTETAPQRFTAKVVIQESDIKTRDALNTWTTNVYVNASISSSAYYKVSSGGAWARVSSSGIYNAASTDHYTFIYNELAENNVENQNHMVRVANISGGTTNTNTYNLNLITNLSSSSAVYFMTHTNNDAPLISRYIGFDISNTASGIPFTKIVTSADRIIPSDIILNTFISLMKASAIFDYTPLSAVERPDMQLLPLRTKGPWVSIKGNAYDQLNTTNWDFSVQDQSVTITIFSAAGIRSTVYLLKTTGTPSVFQLLSSEAGAGLSNQFFSFKFRTYTGETIERASFYLESTEAAAANSLSGSTYTDNYANIYDASLLGGGGTSAVYKLQAPPAALPSFAVYNGENGIRDSLYGATAFTREEVGKEFVYVLGGAHDPTVLNTGGLYEISSPANLRRTISRTASLGQQITVGGVPGSGWEEVSFGVSGYSGDIVAPFQGLYAWVGQRLFVYNPAKYSVVRYFDNNPIPSSYRLISTTTFSGNWDMAALPGSLTNRAHASFFSSQGVLVLAAGLAFDEGSHDAAGGTDAGTYTLANDIWQSYNNGATWSQVSKGAAFSPRYMATTVNIGSDVFMLGGYTNANDTATSFSGEIWKSSDNGLTWIKVAGTLPTELADSYGSRKYGRMPGFVVNNVIYLVSGPNTAGTAGLPPTASIFSSRDGGKTWALEDKIDTNPGGGAALDRTAGASSASFVWSANNTDYKGVLLEIGGAELQNTGEINSLNGNLYRRVLGK